MFWSNEGYIEIQGIVISQFSNRDHIVYVLQCRRQILSSVIFCDLILDKQWQLNISSCQYFCLCYTSIWYTWNQSDWNLKFLQYFVIFRQQLKFTFLRGFFSTYKIVLVRSLYWTKRLNYKWYLFWKDRWEIRPFKRQYLSSEIGCWCLTFGPCRCAAPEWSWSGWSLAIVQVRIWNSKLESRWWKIENPILLKKWKQTDPSVLLLEL